MNAAAEPSTQHGEAADVVAMAEIKSLKPSARVWEKKAGLFFLAKKDDVLANINARQKAAAQLEKEQEEQQQRRRPA